MSSAWKQSACVFCAVDCGVELQIGGADGRQITRVKGDRAHPASAG
ncbi:MAG: hypothetical protein GKR94_06510 [Gammaproteobacteria bacterium]|nr:hypothetical protein [Gammaproteobacteria bacterium]